MNLTIAKLKEKFGNEYETINSVVAGRPDDMVIEPGELAFMPGVVSYVWWDRDWLKRIAEQEARDDAPEGISEGEFGQILKRCGDIDLALCDAADSEWSAYDAARDELGKAYGKLKAEAETLAGIIEDAHGPEGSEEECRLLCSLAGLKAEWDECRAKGGKGLKPLYGAVRVLNTEALAEEAGEYFGWLKESPHGYGMFETEFMGGALLVQAVEALGAFDSDEEAAGRAERDGVRLIRSGDLPECVNPSEREREYVDTPANRAVIRRHLKEAYGVDWEGPEPLPEAEFETTALCPGCGQPLRINSSARLVCGKCGVMGPAQPTAGYAGGSFGIRFGDLGEDFSRDVLAMAGDAGFNTGDDGPSCATEFRFFGGDAPCVPSESVLIPLLTKAAERRKAR